MSANLPDVSGLATLVAAPSKREILALRHQATPQYCRVEVEEWYEPGDMFEMRVGDTTIREVSTRPTRRWRTVFVGPEEQAAREFEAWMALIKKSNKRRGRSD